MEPMNLPTPVGPTPKQVLAPGGRRFAEAAPETQWKFSVSCFSGGQATKIAEIQGQFTTFLAQAAATTFMKQHSCGSKPKLLSVARLGVAGETWAGKWKSCSPCTIQKMAELAASMK
jgi:hypothetical protein